MNVEVLVGDELAIEVFASGLPTHHGAQLAIDITLHSVMTARGMWKRNDFGEGHRVHGVHVIWWLTLEQ